MTQNELHAMLGSWILESACGSRRKQPWCRRSASDMMRVTGGGHEIVALFHHLAVLCGDTKRNSSHQSLRCLKTLNLPGLHSREHVHQTGFNRNAAIFKLRVLVQDIEALRFILVRLARFRRPQEFRALRLSARPMATLCPHARPPPA